MRSHQHDGEFRKRQRSGSITRVRRAVSVTTASWQQALPAEHARAKAHAVQALRKVRHAISHRTAATLCGLPIISNIEKIDLTPLAPHVGRRSKDVRLHELELLAEECTTDQFGLVVTNIERTIVDLLTDKFVLDGVCALDAYLSRVHQEERQQTLATLGHLLASDQFCHRRRNKLAQEILQLADPLAESPAESIARWQLRNSNRPRSQFEIYDSKGLIGRVDFAWPEVKVALEIDGRMKYVRCLNQTAEDVLWAEKLREDRIRAQGWIVVRTVWAQLMSLSGVRGVMNAHPNPVVRSLVS